MLGITLIFFPPAQDDKNKSLYWFIIIVVAIISLILTHLYFHNLSSKAVLKKFKNSIIEDGKIQFFKSRRDLDLRKFLDIAEKEIIFVSVTNEFIVTDYLELVKEYIMNRKINVIFLILYPNSQHLSEMSRYFSIDENSLRQKIETAKRDLLNFRSSLKQNY